MPYPSTLQEMISLATAGVNFPSWPYTLDLLPVEGLTDASQSIGDTRGMLTSTLTILDGIRKGPYGLPAALQQLLSDIRFHVVNGIVLIDAGTRKGHSRRESRLVIEGLQAAIDNQVTAINRARGSWSTWLDDAHANKGQGDVLPPQSTSNARFDGYSADPIVPPVPVATAMGGSLVTFAMVAGVLWFLSR